MLLDHGQIVLATSNRGKINEIRDLLKDIEVVLLSNEELDAPLPDVVEDAVSLEGNARKKAEVALAHAGIPALADDTGLEVDALSGDPGVRSARYAGEDCNAARNRRKLLDALDGAAQRSARFRTVIALADLSGTLVFEGLCEGRIATEERGSGGFGYDAIFIPNGSSKTFAEMSVDEKNRISHRAMALNRLRDFLKAEVGT